MGCRKTIFVNESSIDFPIFYHKISYFSYFLNPEFPIFLFFWPTLVLDTLQNELDCRDTAPLS